MAKRARYDEQDVVPEGHCCGEGCGAMTTLFRVSQWRYRCAACFKKEVGRAAPIVHEAA